jgi:hypothetical protein
MVEYSEGDHGRLSQAPFDLAEKTLGEICVFREPFQGDLALASFIPDLITEIFHSGCLT